jgi:hypothetical protein
MRPRDVRCIARDASSALRRRCASFARIAADETRHAALAHAIDRWAMRRLSSTARKRIARARIAAATTLANELHAEPSMAMQAELGLPTASRAQRMAHALTAPRARAA